MALFIADLTFGTCTATYQGIGLTPSPYNQVLGQGMDGVRAEITVTVRQMVREAIAASVARALSRTERK